VLLAIVIGGWIAVEAVRAYPNHMSYMNQLAGRAPHWWYLSDSNLEWGEDLRALALYLRAHGETSVRDGTLGGFFTLHYYNIVRVDALDPGESPQPTHYTAVGASYLNGSTVPAYDKNGRPVTDQERVNSFAEYRNRVPEAILGGSIYVFRENKP
jgi:hypothetical protein